MRGWVIAPLGLLVVALSLDAGPVLGQQQPGDGDAPAPQVPGDTLELVFEREVFSYPAYERRNPFRPLTGEDQGPRFEDLTLLGVLVSGDPGASIATVGVRQPGTGPQQAPSRIVRLRPGEILGNSRILEVRDQVVLVQVEEFGLFDMRTLVLRRAEPQRPPRPAVPPPAGVPGDLPPDTLPGGDGVADTVPEVSLREGFDRERAGGALTDRTINGNGGRS